MMRLMVLAVLIAMNGCSFLLVRPSPRRLSDAEAKPGEHGSKYCWKYGIPASDLAVGLPLGGMMALGAVASAGTCPSDESRCGREGGIAAATVLAVSVVSAMYGFAATATCMNRL